MGRRRKARESALQVLYQVEMSGNEPHRVLQLFWKNQPEGDAEVRQFTAEIVDGVTRNRPELDELIEKHSTHWRLARMAVVDRNLLRLGVFELLYEREIPVSVTINEAIEIAKKFGTEESGSFINGILDTIAREVKP